MTRRTSLGFSILLASALGSSFGACGGSTNELFTPSGGADSTGGTSTNTAGSSAIGGHSTTGGSSSSAGSNASAGTNANGGSNAAGGHANGGDTSVGGNGNAGTSGNTGGSGNAGGTGGSNSAGTDAGGNAGTSSAGTSSGGSGGSSAGAGGSNSAGTGAGGNPSCQDLMALAESQLAAARACDNSHNAMQCTGKVNTTCGCQVPVESNDSDETKAYLATLKRFQDKPCIIACTELACLPISHAQCQSQGQSGGMCVAVAGPVTQ